MLTWSFYESDKTEVFNETKTPEQWEAIVDEVEFFNTIFTEEEKDEIFNNFANVD